MQQTSKQPAFELGQIVATPALWPRLRRQDNSRASSSRAMSTANGRFVRRRPKRKRLEPRARVPALERLPYTRRRQALDYHGIRSHRDHPLVARRVLKGEIFFS
jgi:hypothetical protein